MSIARMRKDGVKNIFAFIIGLAILLVGFEVSHVLIEGVASSYFASVFMLIGVYVVARVTRLRDYIGSGGITLLLLLSAVIVVFNLVYSQLFVFADYLAHGSGDVSIHPEHSLSYSQMSTISQVLGKGGSLEDLDYLNLNQYKWLYTYYSLMFTFGGNVVTHINVFNMFHLAVAAIFMVLTAVRLGVKERSTLALVLLVCLIQPVLDCLFAYHRDIVGQTALVVGMYLFVCTYKNNMLKFLVFPIYAALFYSFRLQYLVVALLLFLWTLFRDNRRGSSFFIGIVVFLGVVLFIITQMRTEIIMTFFLSDLNITDYVEMERLSFLGNIILGLIGFFPWTQLLVDPNWSYHVFAYLQGAMNITIIYYVLKTNWRRLSNIFVNPVLFTAVLLFVIAFFVAGHTTYVSVAMPLFAVGIKDVKYKRVLNTFLVLCVIYIVLSFLYNAMGLTGAGVLS